MSMTVTLQDGEAPDDAEPPLSISADAVPAPGRFHSNREFVRSRCCRKAML